MKITILVDNNTYKQTLTPEWGLSVFIENGGKKILLDAGQSDKFSLNAQFLEVDLTKVDAGVLSHNHYDHTNGLDTFFEINKTAKVYVRKAFKESCYHKHWFFYEYIGMKKGWLTVYKNRFEFVDGDYKLFDGVYLIPHKTPGLEKIGKAAHFAVKRDGHFVTDTFNHEQSLVFDTPKGLVIMNSCSHAGADNIIKEILETFPGKKIYAILGGFHLFRMKDSEVKAFAQRLKELDVQKIYTGHCTGDHAFEILEKELGDKVKQLYTGMILEI